MDAIRGLVRELGPDVPVLGFAAAPWTLACYMIEGHGKDGFPPQRRCFTPIRNFSKPARTHCAGHGSLFAGANRGGRFGGATV